MNIQPKQGRTIDPMTAGGRQAASYAHAVQRGRVPIGLHASPEEGRLLLEVEPWRP